MSVKAKRPLQLVHRHSSLQHAKTLILRRVLQRLSTSNRRKGYPRLACLIGDHMSEEIIINGLYEEGLLRAIFDGFLNEREMEFRTGIALDVGANIGNHSCFFSPRFQQVWSFEPNPTALVLLQANVLINEASNVRVFPFGLSNKAAELPFAENSAGNLGASLFVPDDHQGPTKRLLVKSGDSVVHEHLTNEKIRLVKVDVEGHELAALEGLSRTLEQHRPLVLFESRGEAEGSAVMNFLRSVGYRDFFAVEKKRVASKNVLLRKIRRAIAGTSYYSSRVERLEDRYYCLIVAIAPA